MFKKPTKGTQFVVFTPIGKLVVTPTSDDIGQGLVIDLDDTQIVRIENKVDTKQLDTYVWDNSQEDFVFKSTLDTEESTLGRNVDITA